jgi:hypothetical protein
MRTKLLLFAFTGVCLAQQPVGTVESKDVSVRGAVTLTGPTAELRSGAQVSTAEQAATLRLARGGSLRICPRSSLQITASPTGRELLIALDSGAIETDYSMTGSADAIMTADLQLQLTGPGTFHYAIGTDRSQVCARSLAGTNASIIVNESLGSGSYQLRPGEGVLFKEGTVASAQPQATVACGCPPETVKAAPPELGFPEQQSRAAATAMAQGQTPPAAPPLAGVPETTSKPDETITQVNVPLSFSASAPPPPVPASPIPVPGPAEPVTDAKIAVLPSLAQPVIQAPVKPKTTNWLKRFFSKMFR